MSVSIDELIKIREQKIKENNGYHYISLPKQLFDSGILDVNGKYRAYLEKVEGTD